MTAAPASSRHFIPLDGLRGLAALEVVLGHAVWLLWSTDESLRAWSLARKAVAFLVRYGFQAVVLFFILSGFLIHLRAARQRAAGSKVELSIGRYARNRLLRLYPPVLAAILVTALCDAVGMRINPAFYEGSVLHSLDFLFVTLSHSWLALVGNLLFLQGHFVSIPPFGTDSPLWFLAYQGFYYLAYIVAYVPLYRVSGPHRAFGVVLVVSLACFLLALSISSLSDLRIVSILAYACTWFFGAWLADMYVRGFRIRRPGLWFVGASAGLITLMLGYSWHLTQVVRDWLWASVFGAWLMLAVAVDDRAQVPPPVRWYNAVLVGLGWTASSSYTLYVVHFPILVLMSAWWLNRHADLPRPGWLTLAGSIGVFAFSLAMAELVERPFLSGGKVRRAITRLERQVNPNGELERGG